MSITQLQFDFVPSTLPINTTNFFNKLNHLNIQEKVILEHIDRILPQRSYGMRGERICRTGDKVAYAFGDENWNDFHFNFENGLLVAIGFRVDYRTPKMFIDQIAEIVKTYNLWVRPFTRGLNNKVYKDYITDPISEIPFVMKMFEKDMNMDANLRDIDHWKECAIL